MKDRVFRIMGRLAKSLVELGFQNFREVIAAASGLGTGLCIAWIGWLSRGQLPPGWLFIVLGGLFAFNYWAHLEERRNQRFVPGTPRERLFHTGVRVWVACSFAALISASALASVLGFWAVCHLFLDTLSVQASTTAFTPSGEIPFGPFLRFGGTAAAVGGALAVAYGYTLGQRRIDVTRTSIPVPSLPGSLEGIRIAHISDIHVGPYLALGQLSEYVDRVNDLNADLIVITGDIVDQRVSDLDPALPVLARLRARYGVVAILGNHDHRAGADAIAERLARATDFILLRDGRVTVGPGNRPLHIVGIEDRGGAIKRGAHEERRLSRLLAEIPANHPVILLNHRPELFEFAAEAGVALTLSGHTHGGQVALRIGRQRVLGPGNLMSRFTRGLFRQGNSYLYVNRGLGVVAQPVRAGSLREIGVLRLVSSVGPVEEIATAA